MTIETWHPVRGPSGQGAARSKLGVVGMGADGQGPFGDRKRILVG